jgi:hypothetical protein
VHPNLKILRAIEKLEYSKAGLESRRNELVGYEVQYIDIISNLIDIMKSSVKNTHWFKMTGDGSWDTKDRWKRDALRLAEQLLAEDENLEDQA